VGVFKGCSIYVICYVTENNALSRCLIRAAASYGAPCWVQHLEIIRSICEKGRDRHPHPRSHRPQGGRGEKRHHREGIPALWFPSVSVFAQEQTDGQPLPELNTNATEGGKAIAGNAEGYSKGGLIEIEKRLDTPARCGVIAHEIGHELMHRTNREGTTRQQRELEAESVSYAVLAHFGIHSPLLSCNL
jgi:IrrE N-terminal-like domain